MSPRLGRDPHARGFPRTPEPFGFTANPATYIPREATERALSQLLDASRGPEWITALTGPPGIGKSLLLHLLATRLEDELHPVFLSYGALTPEDLCAYALDRLGSPRTDDPVGVLKAYARHLKEQDSALLLLVDDTGAVPGATLRWLSDLLRSSGSSMRGVFAVTDDVNSGATIASLGTAVAVVRLAEPMTRQETGDYVEAHLAVGRVSGAVRALFDDATITRLHELSGGVPRRLHTAAQAVLRREPATPPSPDATLDEQESALDAPSERAMNVPIAGIASEIHEELGRLWQEIASRRSARRRPFFRRSATMAIAFAAAAVAGLLISFRFLPLFSRIAPEPEPPAAVVEPATAETLRAPATAEPVLEPAAPETPPPAPEEAVAEAPAPAAPAPEAPAAARVPVNINATPWATVEVDGEPLGETPLAGVPLTEGPHTFRARMPDGRIVERVVEIDEENRFVVLDAAPAATPASP
jgi:type II secretory pathway predicted ATPase ExeA